MLAPEAAKALGVVSEVVEWEMIRKNFYNQPHMPETSLRQSDTGRYKHSTSPLDMTVEGTPADQHYLQGRGRWSTC